MREKKTGGKQSVPRSTALGTQLAIPVLNVGLFTVTLSKHYLFLQNIQLGSRYYYQQAGPQWYWNYSMTFFTAKKLTTALQMGHVKG